MNKVIKLIYDWWSKLGFPEKGFVSVSIFLALIFIVKGIENSLTRNNIDKKIQLSSQKNSFEGKEDTTIGSGYYSYEIIENQAYKYHDNYLVSLSMKENKKELVEKAMLEIKVRICQRSCNIYAYDSKKGYDWDKLMEYEKRAASMDQNFKSKKNKIEKEYYVYVADHTIASISFEDNNVTYYPYRDWRYKELGGKNKINSD